MNKALDYAEKKLGVHTVWEDAQSQLAELNELYTDLDKSQDQRRELAEQIADREGELLSDERGRHPEMSAAAFDQHFKGIKRGDTALQGFRAKHMEVSGIINGLEYDVDLLKHRLRLSEARLIELGGYFNYLASVKQDETANKTDRTTST